MRARMSLEDWHAELEIRPLTGSQLGRLHYEARRLGLDNRAERLAVAASLLGVDGLGSFTELRQGQAGWLVHFLDGIASRAELDAMLPAEPEPAPLPRPPRT